MQEKKMLQFRGGPGMALIPFAVFIVVTIGLSFMQAASLNMMIGAGVVGLLIGMLFGKGRRRLLGGDSLWSWIKGRRHRRHALAGCRYLRKHSQKRAHR